MDNIPAPEGGSLPVGQAPETPSQPLDRVEAPIPQPENPEAEKPAEQPQPEQPSAAQEAISVVKQTTEELKGKQPTGEERMLTPPPERGTRIKTWPNTATAIEMTNKRQEKLAEVARSREEKAA